jgi:outer membrane protein OmpA-like peptidoglycan-associated protein
MRYLRAEFLWVAATGMVGAPPAAAQSIEIEHFEPAPTLEGLASIKAATAEGAGDMMVGLSVTYQREPLLIVDDAGQRQATLVSDRVNAALSYALGLPVPAAAARLVTGIDVAALMPFVPGERGAGMGTTGFSTLHWAAAIADPQLEARVAFATRPLLGVDVALIPVLSVPTASGAKYVGNGSFMLTPEVAVSRALGPVFLGANIGFRARRAHSLADIEIGSQWLWRAGAGLDVGAVGGPGGLAVSFEAFGLARGSDPWSSGRESPAEVLAAGRYRLPLRRLSSFVVSAGLGAGLTNGYGAPKMRALVGLAWAPRTVDSDNDGLLDRDDKCPNEPEDRDGYADDDGCPDPDNDGDGIADALDKCPNEPEDRDGYADDDGCPDPDNDGDGVPDAVDACPLLAEDHDGFQDDDGCPDGDNDGDGIWDRYDKCPNEPETINGVADDDGCPDKGAQKVELTANKIEIKERVYFDTNSDVIQSRSFALLDQVAALLKNHGELQHIRVEGHTDDQGLFEYNLRLSERRADSVRRYLVDRGVAAERLEAMGYGESRPIASNKSARGREMNRRVEFTIIPDAK